MFLIPCLVCQKLFPPKLQLCKFLTFTSVKYFTNYLQPLPSRKAREMTRFYHLTQKWKFCLLDKKQHHRLPYFGWMTVGEYSFSASLMPRKSEKLDDSVLRIPTQLNSFSINYFCFTYTKQKCIKFNLGTYHSSPWVSKTLNFHRNIPTTSWVTVKADIKMLLSLPMFLGKERSEINIKWYRIWYIHKNNFTIWKVLDKIP